MKNRSNRSPIMKRKRKSFNRSPIPKRRLFNCFLQMVRGCKKNRAHLEMFTSPATMSTPLVSASIPLGMSASLGTTSTPPISASIPLRTSASPTTMSTPPATLTRFPQLPYSSPAPISTPSSLFSTRTSSRPDPSSSARPPAPPVFNKQSACAKSITGIIKEHFVEAHASFGKIPNRIKNMRYTELKKR
ncbi:hypothetical protein M9H77_36879 [Catharanthus roseus]|uniref:Uncharacterized protein n=1 Tax=Catharanthus roseus TaxID=4058 RepID=A0ACB9ZU44_CATRO|nr:hypothetical protein M9H77_36879 [Catharanthus roseus]